MRFSRDPDRCVPDFETWDLPLRLNPDDCRAETTDRAREPAHFQDEDADD